MIEHHQGRYSQAEFAALDDPQLPERFQNYVLDRNKIGEGPVSYCYRAKRIDDGRQVRLKILRKRVCSLPGIAELHRQLSRVSTQYAGENVLRFAGSGMHNDILICEFEYIESVSLRSLVDDAAPFHPDLVVLLAMGIIAGLNQIHGMRPSPGMGNLIPLHRNLKPENVLIASKGTIKITDIDAQQIADLCDAARLEIPYPMTVYQSPEQLLREGYADRRSDIYSLGLIMLEMATGRLPYQGNNVFEVRQNVRENKRIKSDSLYPVSKDHQRKLLAQRLAGIIERMIAPDPDRRPQSLVEVEGQINHYVEGSNYADAARSIADFLRVKSFHSERKRKHGFIDKLLGR